MAVKFELKQGSNGQFMFNLKAGIGEVVLTSELYKEKQSAIAGIDSVKANAGEDARYERKTSKNGQPFFVLKAANGQTCRTKRNVLIDCRDRPRHRLRQEECSECSRPGQYGEESGGSLLKTPNFEQGLSTLIIHYSGSRRMKNISV